CSSRRRHTRFSRDWSSDVCSSELVLVPPWMLRRAEQGYELIHLHESRYLHRRRLEIGKRVVQEISESEALLRRRAAVIQKGHHGHPGRIGYFADDVAGSEKR